MWISIKEVARRLGVSTRTIYKRMGDATNPFPAPLHIGASVRWDEAEIEAWVTRQRSGPAAAPLQKSKPTLTRRTA